MIAIGLAMIAIVGFGSATIFARQGMARVGPMPVVLLSLCVSFLASGIVSVIFAASDFITLPLIVLAWCLMLGTFNFLGGRNLSYLAVGRIGAARTGAIVGTSAVFSAILAVGITGERPHWVVLLGTVVVVAGLATALGKNIIESAGETGATRRTAFIGFLLALGAACCYGTTNVVVKQLTVDTSPLVISTISLFFGAMLVAPVAAKQAVLALPEVRRTPAFPVFAALSGLAAATGVNCAYFALQRADVVVVSPIVASNPLFTLVLAALFLPVQEDINRWLVFGIVITVVGVGLVVLGSTLGP